MRNRLVVSMAIVDQHESIHLNFRCERAHIFSIWFAFLSARIELKGSRVYLALQWGNKLTRYENEEIHMKLLHNFVCTHNFCTYFNQFHMKYTVKLTAAIFYIYLHVDRLTRRISAHRNRCKKLNWTHEAVAAAITNKQITKSAFVTCTDRNCLL